VRRILVVFITSAVALIEGGCHSANALRYSPDLNTGRADQSSTQFAPPGTRTASLPPGSGMDAVRSRCVVCHEPAMLLQQRRNAQQWSAEINKMQAWGALVSNEDKTRMTSYLVTIAGPDNTRFTPAMVAPIPSTRPSTPEATAQP